MTLSKRLIDIGLALILGLLLLLPMTAIALWIWRKDGGPVIYASERMKTVTEPFTLLKFRTMTHDPDDVGVSSAYKQGRITRTGRLLRRTRFDELPQLWNILRGDMSFVGPRPPLRRYVELRPDLYEKVLCCRPGVTGLATLRYHAHEEAILAECSSPEATHDAYLRRCVPAKARLDLIYARHWTLCFDGVLIIQTVEGVLLHRGKTRKRTQGRTRG